MDERQDPFSPQVIGRFPGDSPERVAEDPRRRTLRRRLLILLCAMCLAFGVTTWLLIRYENPFGLFRLASGPANIVRAQLEALNRGDLRGAYNFFSPKYRREVSFEAFHQLVVTHRGMFRTRQLRIGQDDESGGRAVLVTHLVAEGGKRYVARFTLVQADGRWWVDDLRWTSEPSPHEKSRA